MADFELAYREAESFFHRMDPVSKLLYVTGVSFVAIFNSSLAVGLALLVLTFVCAAFFTNISLRTYWSVGKIVMPFILILAFVFPFFYAGQVSVGSEEIAVRTPIKDLSWAALGFGALLAMRFLAIGMSGLTFAFTTHPTDLVHGVSRRGLDYRLVHAPVLGLVLFPSFLQMAREISTTQRIRDLGQHSGWLRRKVGRLRHLAFAMLVMGLRRGQTQAMALDIRGYGAHKTRTFMRTLPSSTSGKVFARTFFVLSVVYLVMQFTGNAGSMVWNWG